MNAVLKRIHAAGADTVGLQRCEHQGKLGVRNCEMFLSLKFDNVDDCKTCENKSTLYG